MTTPLRGGHDSLLKEIARYLRLKFEAGGVKLFKMNLLLVVEVSCLAEFRRRFTNMPFEQTYKL